MKDSINRPADPPPTEATASPLLTPEQQSDRIAELFLASAQRLATDPEHLAKIKKRLF